MSKIDDAWVREQMQGARIKLGVGNAVLKLLETWTSISLKSPASDEVIQLFSKLALGHAIVEPDPEEVWLPAQPGFIGTGDKIRVMNNAYSGEGGKMHNGRQGTVVGVRHGDIVVRYTDGKSPALDGAHHSPHQLEKKMR